MCGRFGSSFSGNDLVDRYDLFEKSPKFEISYNVTPGSYIPTVIKKSPNRLVMMKWGFVPEWADPGKLKLHPINARDDQLDISDFYKSAFAHNRCLIPFSWFYEWKRFTLDGKEQKQPNLIKVKGDKIMSFAGIYSAKKDAEGLPVYTCAIVTTTPNLLVKKIHTRMPVILAGGDEDLWLGSGNDVNKLKNCLKPFDASEMEAYKIGLSVNNPKNDGPELIKPLK